MFACVLALSIISDFAVSRNAEAAPPIVPSVIPPSPTTQGSVRDYYQFDVNKPPSVSPPFSESNCDGTLAIPDIVSKLTDPGLKKKAFADEIAIINSRLQACLVRITDTYKPPPHDQNGQALLTVAKQDCNPSSNSDYPDIYYDATIAKGTDDSSMAIRLLLKTERFTRCAAFANQSYPPNTSRLICNAVGPLGFGIGLYAAIFSKHWNSGLQGGVPFFASQLPGAIQNEPACK
jgi:hypothetical protein